MKLEKRDVAECLGLVYNGTKFGYDNFTHKEYKFYKFSFEGKEILVYADKELGEAWEESANKVLEPLVELLKSKL